MRRAYPWIGGGALALGLALGACVGTDTPTSTAKGLFVQPASTVIAAGATQQLTVIMSPPDLVPGGLSAVTWSSSDTHVATVSNAGLVTGVAAGVATITANAGQYHASAGVRVLTP